MILRSLTIHLCLVFLLQKESEAWTTRPALGSRSRLPPLQPSQQAWRKSPTVQRLNRSSNDEIEFIECDSGLGNSRRRLLGSIGAVAASALGISIAAPALPSNAEATLVSAKSVCDATVSVWSKNGRIIYLLGTAHISETSAELAGRLVKDTNPNGVFIELDPKRVSGTGALAQKFQGDENSPAPARESKIIVPVVSQAPGGGFVLASGPPSSPGGEVAVDAAALPAPKPTPPKANNNPVTKAATAVVGKQLKGLYSRLDAAGFDSGEEFVRAVKEGKKLGADIVLGDRDVEVTLRRITEGLAKTDLKAFLSPDSELERTMQEMMPVNTAVQERLAGADNSQELSNEEFKAELTGFVEAMKTKENVKKIMGQLQRVAPALYEALVSERDAYMAAGLNGLNELESIVAVVGIAHADGIETTLQQNGWKAANPACPK